MVLPEPITQEFYFMEGLGALSYLPVNSLKHNGRSCLKFFSSLTLVAISDVRSLFISFCICM